MGRGSRQAWVQIRVTHRSPRRTGGQFELRPPEVTGHLPPPAPRCYNVPDRVSQIPCPVQPQTACLRRPCQQRRDDRPFPIGAVACVPQTSSIMLGPSGFGLAHVITKVFATRGQSRLTEIAQLDFRSGSEK